MAGLGAGDEVGEGEAVEDGAAFVVELDPDLLEHAMTFAVVVAFGERGCWAFDGADDLGERDVGWWAGEDVATANAAFGSHESGAFDREQNLFEVGLGEFRALGNLFDGGWAFFAVQREREEGSGRVVTAG